MGIPGYRRVRLGTSSCPFVSGTHGLRGSPRKPNGSQRKQRRENMRHKERNKSGNGRSKRKRVMMPMCKKSMTTWLLCRMTQPGRNSNSKPSPQTYYGVKSITNRREATAMNSGAWKFSNLTSRNCKCTRVVRGKRRHRPTESMERLCKGQDE